MRTISTAIALFLGWPLGAVVHAQDAIPFSCPKPGTIIEATNGGKITFGESDGLTCRYTNRAGQPVARVAVVIDGDDPNAKTYKDEFPKLWPAKVGNQISFATAVTGGIRYTNSYTVQSVESVTVPAGTFDVVVLQHERVGGSASARYRHLANFYYAPTVGHMVKFEFNLLQGNRRDAPQNWEAAKIVIP
jgi:hypothetical protein